MKNYNPPGGIDAATDLHFDPTSQNWAANTPVSCPQGFGGSDVISHTTCHTIGIVTDTSVPASGVDRGTWQSGINYNQYDKTLDPGDSNNQYTALGANPNTSLQPHLNIGVAGWARTAFNGCAARVRDSGFYSSMRVTGDASRWFSAEVHARGVSGGSEPTFSGTGFDGTAYITRVIVYKGDWAPSTNYNNGDYVRNDGSFWKVIGGGISDPTPPNFTGTFYGNACSDTNNLYRRDYIDAGLWAPSTTYGYKVVTGKTVTQGGTDVRSQALRGTNGTSICVYNNASGTDALTGGSEPAWSAAAAGSFWEDGTVIWRFGTFAVPNPTLQNERLVLTGLATPAANGKTVRIFNDAAAGSKIDVVLLDRNALCGGGDQLILTGTDKLSTSGFNCDVAAVAMGYRIPEGGSATVVYNSGSGLWVLQAQASGGTTQRTMLDVGT